MPTRNVVLTDHQADLFERLVASGRYQNASELGSAGSLLNSHVIASRLGEWGCQSFGKR